MEIKPKTLCELVFLEDAAKKIAENMTFEDYLSENAFRLNLVQRLRESALEGELACYDRFGVYRPKAHEAFISTRPKALNDWFALIQSPLRYPESEGNSHSKPWDIPRPDDPKPEQHWYIPARYFARELVKEDSTLLLKKDLLAKKVANLLSDVGIKKRGGKLPLNPTTVKKAFSNITFG